MGLKIAVPHLIKSMDPNSKKAVIDPNENDVLCGRGTRAYRHPGNKKFRSIVAKNKLTYNKSENSVKPIIAKGIVTYIETRVPSGRYLIQDQERTGWYKISHAAAVQKTQQALREKAKWVKNDSQFAVLDSNKIETDKQVSSSRKKLTKCKSSCPKSVNTDSDNILDRAADPDIFPLINSAKTSNEDAHFELEKTLITSGNPLTYANSSIPNAISKKDDIDKLIIDTFYSSSTLNRSDVVVMNKYQQQQINDETRVKGNTITTKRKRLLNSNKIKSIHESFAKERQILTVTTDGDYFDRVLSS